MIALLCACFVSTLLTLLVLRALKHHTARNARRDGRNPQNFHALAAPRLGGLGIVAGIVVAMLAQAWSAGAMHAPTVWLLLACAVPAFVSGIVQDYTEAIAPSGRLLATAVSAVLAYFAIGAAVREAGIPGIDWLLSFAIGSLVGTVVAVAGIANAINIIDGFNGLASMCVMLMLGAVAYVAFQCGDTMVATLALAGMGAVLGFFLWNFPGGLIFLGDGGAYFLGFFLAELNILLVVRNPGEVSPLLPVLICIYPVFETLFSIYRRSMLRAMPASTPDGIHLHSLIYRRMLRWTIGDRSAKAMTRRNSLTSPFLWLLCSLSLVPAVLFWNQTAWIAGALVLFIVSYVVLYWRIVRFRSPRWMRVVANTAPGALRESDNPGL